MVAPKMNFEIGSSRLEDFAYWINERHRIYVKRFIYEQPRPWTEDRILRDYRFTNAFRELDKGTLALREMLPITTASRTMVVWNVIWYRLFNRYEHATDIGLTKDIVELEEKLRELDRRGNRMFTSAHMTVGRAGESKVETMIQTLWRIFDELIILTDSLFEERTLESAFKKLLACRYYGIGKFIAYEIVTDFRWYDVLWHPFGAPLDTMTWANIGPGCERGLKRLGYAWPELLDLRSVHTHVLPLLEEHVKTCVFPFELREAEHSLCEFDKYARGKPKQRYHGGR